MSSLHPTPFQNAVRTIMEKAAADELFRTLCLEDPAEAFHSVSRLRLPEDLKLRFVECAADEVLVVLPPLRPAGAPAPELSDGELNQVVGGADLTAVQWAWARSCALGE